MEEVQVLPINIFWPATKYYIALQVIDTYTQSEPVDTVITSSHFLHKPILRGLETSLSSHWTAIVEVDW